MHSRLIVVNRDREGRQFIAQDVVIRFVGHLY